MTGTRVELLALREIKIGERHRKDLGDLSGLANSIRHLGLLQPIVVTPELDLISGRRRMEAFRSLGKSYIQAHVVQNLTEAADRLRAERDENTCRKAFTPTEEHSLYEALLQLERPKAQERKAQAPGQSQGTKVSSAKFAGQTGASRKLASAGATGKAGRHTTLEKVGEVKRVAQAPETPEPVREVAQKALREMDGTGRVDGAYQRVKDAERAAAAPKPSPGVSKYLNESKTLQDLSYIHEFSKAFARCGDWLRFDPQRVGELIDETDLKLMHLHLGSAERFVKAVTSARRGLRLISGGAEE